MRNTIALLPTRRSARTGLDHRPLHISAHRPLHTMQRSVLSCVDLGGCRIIQSTQSRCSRHQSGRVLEAGGVSAPHDVTQCVGNSEYPSFPSQSVCQRQTCRSDHLKQLPFIAMTFITINLRNWPRRAPCDTEQASHFQFARRLRILGLQLAKQASPTR